MFRFCFRLVAHPEKTLGRFLFFFVGVGGLSGSLIGVRISERMFWLTGKVPGKLQSVLAFHSPLDHGQFASFLDPNENS